MASIKYIDENGNVKTISQYKVNDIQIVQVEGENEDKVMSQKAVTDKFNELPTFERTPDGRFIINCGTFGNV